MARAGWKSGYLLAEKPKPPRPTATVSELPLPSLMHSLLDAIEPPATRE